MNLTSRDRRALALMGGALLLAAIVHFALPDSSSVTVTTSAGSVDAMQQRLIRMRQIAATLPVEEARMKQATADLQDREKGLIAGATAAEAQATLIEIARRLGKTEQLDIRTGELGAPKVLGDYGLVYATVTFDAHIEQLVNFLADLSHAPELILPSEQRIAASNLKDKILIVRMVLAGAVPRKLVPERKGLGAF